MWAIALEILKALVAGDFKRWWQEHKENEAKDAANKDAALSSADAQRKLHADWQRD